VHIISQFDEYPDEDDGDNDGLYDEDDEEFQAEEDDDGEDQGKKEKEQKDEVSYTRVGISYLVPRVFELLDGPGWHNIDGVANP
jgi:hypothetical protein